MGVLYARVSGAWVPIGNGTPAVVGVLTGTYTPTLTGLAIGTGGSATNTAWYSYFAGRLFVEGRIVFGTSGQTFPNNPTITLPAGYTFTDTNDRPIGWGKAFDNSTNHVCVIWANSATTIVPYLARASTTFITPTGITTVLPFAWAAGHQITYSYEARVTGP